MVSAEAPVSNPRKYWASDRADDAARTAGQSLTAPRISAGAPAGNISLRNDAPLTSRHSRTQVVDMLWSLRLSAPESSALHEARGGAISVHAHFVATVVDDQAFEHAEHVHADEHRGL